MTTTPMFGFTWYNWKNYRKCARCKRKIKRGVVNIHHVGHELDPAFRCLCGGCYETILEVSSDGVTVPN